MLASRSTAMIARPVQMNAGFAWPTGPGGMIFLARAAERGEVRLEKVTPLIAALPGNLLRHELLLSNATVPEAYLTEIVDDIFSPLVAACQPSCPRSPRRNEKPAGDTAATA
jgi:hypothetical protein